MSCEHLICGQCAGPVSEGRCPACRATRQHIHHTHFTVSPQIIVAAILVLTVLLLLATHLATR
jgi:succinate dehydrogenase/fumarate reductase-like Fe-S protein